MGPTFHIWQVGGLKALVERQMRSQTDIEEALRMHTRTVRVCE